MRDKIITTYSRPSIANRNSLVLGVVQISESYGLMKNIFSMEHTPKYKRKWGLDLRVFGLARVYCITCDTINNVTA